MSYTLIFSHSSLKEISRIKRNNPARYNKLSKLLEELMSHPRTGTGHPEPLKSGGGVTYSRRINAHDRLIYDIYDDRVEVLVLSVCGHYNDK